MELSKGFAFACGAALKKDLALVKKCVKYFQLAVVVLVEVELTVVVKTCVSEFTAALVKFGACDVIIKQVIEVFVEVTTTVIVQKKVIFFTD